jgi:phosphoribosylformylglycinamidine synthase subunit PurSL
MRIETCFSRPGLDGRGAAPANRLSASLPFPASVVIADVVLLDFPLSRETATELFCDPIVQFVAEAPVPELPSVAPWDWLVEIAYRPGVTDTLALTAREAIKIAEALPASAGKAGLVQTARLYVVRAPGTVLDDVKAAFSAFWNPLIQSAIFVSRADWKGGARLPDPYPAVSLSDDSEPELFDLSALDDAGLEGLSTRRLLALSLPEMRAVRAYFSSHETRRARAARGLPGEATDVEIEMIAQTWSEHCKHKIFNAEIEYSEPGEAPRSIRSLFKTCIRGATEELAPKRPDLLSVFTDNAGVFKFDDAVAVCVKAETHNSPSALDPYGGAITGIVGVNRDILGTGMGASPLFNTDVLCFAPPGIPDEEVPEGLILPRELLAGVHRGIVDGGNQSGIPVAAGAFLFDEGYMGKPLVFCGTGGIMPLEVRGKPSWEKAISSGMLAVMVGGRIGKDGIHGATFSSLALDETSPTSAVQIGDPIIQKRMSDFLLEARDEGLYAGITDNGAGGLSSSLCEMAESSGGVRIDLDACPLKYAGLSAWEILVSESQERMSLSVRPETLPALLALAARRGVEATVVGEFTASGRVEATYRGKTVCLVDMEFLHRGLPGMRLAARWVPPEVPSSPLEDRADWKDVLLAVLADPDVASKEALVRQYDHEVKAMSIEKPLTGVMRDAPSDGGVLKPLYDSWRGLTVAHGICPRLSSRDTRAMALAAVDEAYRAHIALGGDPERAVALDNFCWPDPVESASNPDGAYKLAQLVRACEALREACLAYGLPLVSGKDSMKNDAFAGGRRISIAPTLLVTLVGIIDDVRKAPSTDLLAPGDLLYVVGATGSLLGASILERVLSGLGGHGKHAKARGRSPSQDCLLGACPVADPAEHLHVYKALAKAASGRALRSIHDLSDGGLAVAAAESCLGGRLGAELRLDAMPRRSGEILRSEGADAPSRYPDSAALLFAEDTGRFLVSIRPEDRERFERSMSGLPVALVGETVPEARLRARLGGKVILDAGLAEIERAYKTPIA